MPKIEENILTASKILNILASGKEISKFNNKDYYDKYDKNKDVADYLKIICDGLGLSLYDYEGKLFLSPGANNSTFGYSNEAMRTKVFKTFSNPHLYLAYFVMMVIVTMFYRESDYDTHVTRIRIDEIIESVNKKIETLKQKDISKLSSEFTYNFESIVNLWESMREVDYKANNELSERGKKNKYSFVNTVCDFLEKEELVKKDDNMKTILPQERFKAIIYGYFQDVDSRNKLFDFVRNLSKEEVV